MSKMNALMKDTAIYGLSSIVGRFLNYLLVPLYTHYMPKESGDYGVSTNIYAYVALILVLLTFGMETTLFRFANDGPDAQSATSGRRWPDTVFTTRSPPSSWLLSSASSRRLPTTWAMPNITTTC